MAASVRIDAAAFVDPRFEMLGRLLGTSRFDALGRMAYVWGWCTERQRYDVPAFFLSAFFPVDSAADLLVSAELGEWVDCTEAGSHPASCKHVRVRGTASRIEWLGDRRATAQAAGRARVARAHRDERGRLLPSSATSIGPASAGVAGPASPARHPAEASALAPSLSPALVLVKEREGRDDGLVLAEGTQPGVKRGGRKLPALPLPASWSPNRDHIQLAREQGVDLNREAAKFRDWALAKDERKVRWDAAFSGWLRRAGEYGGSRAPAPARGRTPKLLGDGYSSPNPDSPRRET